MPLLSAINLKSLPPPAVVSTLTFQNIFDETLALFAEADEKYAYYLASDPVVKVIQAIAYRELVWRELLNQTLQQSFLAFATDTNLDHLGGLYQVERLEVEEGDSTAVPPVLPVYEDDEAFRTRIQARIMGYSSAGSADSYRFFALSADPLVRDVSVYSPDMPNGMNMGGRVNITVMSNSETRLPTLDLLAAVRSVVIRRDVKAINDIVTVEPAVGKDVVVRADIVLDVNTPYEVFANLGTVLENAFNATQKLGWDVALSWVHKTLMVDGVYEVRLIFPDETKQIRFNEFARLVGVDIRFAGFAATNEQDIEEQERNRIYQAVYEYYIEYAITVKITAAQIALDLTKTAKPGIIQPSTLGLARYMAITPLNDPITGQVLLNQELAELIYTELSKYYDGTYQRARRL